MNTPTFKEQFDKITTAYFENKLEPMNCCACFIGNMLNSKGEWADGREFKWNSSEKQEDYGWVDYSDYVFFNKYTGCFLRATSCVKAESSGLYSYEEVIELESNFLTIWYQGGKTEQSLFDAMDSTLDMLRELHISKGEQVDNYEFKQRTLTHA